MTKQTLWLRSAAALLTLLLLAACGESPRGAARADSSPQAPIPVQTITVEMQEIPLLYTTTGTVHARTETPLSSQVMARVLRVNVQAGDHVRPGQTLVSLDSQEAEASYRKAEAERAEAQSAIAENDNGIAQAKANLDLANLTSRRMNDLYAKRSISQQELDENNAKLKNAQANYEMARARREELNNRIAEDSAALQQAQASRSYSVIHAPFAGVITARNVEPGAIAVPGISLLTIEGGGGYRLYAAVEEARSALVHLKDAVTVQVDSLPNEVTGRVIELSPVSDANSHSFTVKIDLPADVRLHSGQFGHVSFAAGNKRAITVPAASVVENGQLQSIFVDDHKIARLRLVTLGEKRGAQVEILSGLQPGELVIDPVPNGLADGDKVEERP